MHRNSVLLYLNGAQTNTAEIRIPLLKQNSAKKSKTKHLRNNERVFMAKSLHKALMTRYNF